MKSIEELTGLYSLSKTLRFELKPIGKTLEQIERKGLLTQDEQRSEEYERMKIIIDDYHKRFIAMCLRNCKLKVENIDNQNDSLEEYASLLSKSKRDDSDEIVLEKIKENRLYRFCPWIAHTNLLAKYHRATVQEERQVTYTPKFGSEAFHL